MEGFCALLGVSGGSVILSLRWRIGAAFVIAFLCGTSISTALILGSRMPLPDNVSPLARSTCLLPCTLEIIPGETTRADALIRLEKIFFVQDPLQSLFGLPELVSPTSESLPFTLQIQYNGEDKVSSLRLIANPNLAVAKLGDLLQLGGEPARVFRSCVGMFPFRMLMVFGVHEQTTVELLLHGELNVDTPVIMMHTAEPGTRTLYDARQSFGCTVESVWRGFAPLWRYIEDAPAI